MKNSANKTADHSSDHETASEHNSGSAFGDNYHLLAIVQQGSSVILEQYARPISDVDDRRDINKYKP